MKTFKEFIKEADERRCLMWSEAVGFKKEADKKRKKNAKDIYQSARDAKLKDLRKRPDSWKNLQ